MRQLDFNGKQYKIGYISTEMKNKGNINSYWQTCELINKNGEQVKAMNFLDNVRRRKGGLWWLSMEWRAAKNYYDYADRLLKYYNAQNLGNLAQAMSQQWGFDIDECFRFILCNLFNQFPKGFKAEDKVMADYECVIMYDDDPTEEWNTAMEISPAAMDYQGVDFVAWIDGKLTAVQIKSATDQAGINRFKNQINYQNKIQHLCNFKGYAQDGHQVERRMMLYVLDNGQRIIEYAR